MTSPRPSRPTPRRRRRPATSAGSRPTAAASTRRSRRRSSPPPVNTPTAVVEGADGIFRIGRSTEIVAVRGRRRLHGQDPERQGRPAEVPRGRHGRRPPREAPGQGRPPTSTAPGAAAQGLRDLHRRGAAPDLAADAIKTRHILYSPNGDPSQASTVDPARSGLGGRPPEGPGRLRPAQAEARAVRRDRPHGERRDPGAGADRHPAASCRTSTARAASTPRSWRPSWTRT